MKVGRNAISSNSLRVMLLPDNWTSRTHYNTLLGVHTAEKRERCGLTRLGVNRNNNAPVLKPGNK